MFTSEYSNSVGYRPLVMEKATTKWKYSNIHELAPNCPRCASSNTKFCYYNNYSLSQPRYFCKACRRYWTKGGSLRNVPIGGGCRKSRRSRAGRQAAGGHAPACNVQGSTDESSGGAVIDMAAVFAKYVNQDGENEEYSSSLGASSGSSENFQASSLEIDSRQMEDITMFEYQKPTFNDQNMQQQQVISQDIITGQELVFQDPKAFELEQGVLCDELVADMNMMLGLESTTLPTIGSQQPLVQVEDYGLFSPDDQLRISADNWASFDLSAYDFYSTP
ncbi:hypothetical protein ACS0TY_014050 [Phlomoides rotata]